jgi:hypothetical protein
VIILSDLRVVVVGHCNARNPALFHRDPSPVHLSPTLRCTAKHIRRPPRQVANASTQQAAALLHNQAENKQAKAQRAHSCRSSDHLIFSISSSSQLLLPLLSELSHNLILHRKSQHPLTVIAQTPPPLHYQAPSPATARAPVTSQ